MGLIDLLMVVFVVLAAFLLILVYWFIGSFVVSIEVILEKTDAPVGPMRVFMILIWPIIVLFGLFMLLVYLLSQFLALLTKLSDTTGVGGAFREADDMGSKLAKLLLS